MPRMTSFILARRSFFTGDGNPAVGYRSSFGPRLLGLRIYHGSPFFHPLFDLFLHTLIGRLVIPLEGPQIVLGHEMFGMVVGVLISFAMSQALRAFVMAVAEVLWHGQRPA